MTYAWLSDPDWLGRWCREDLSEVELDAVSEQRPVVLDGNELDL